MIIRSISRKRYSLTSKHLEERDPRRFGTVSLYIYGVTARAMQNVIASSGEGNTVDLYFIHLIRKKTYPSVGHSVVRTDKGVRIGCAEFSKWTFNRIVRTLGADHLVIE